MGARGAVASVVAQSAGAEIRRRIRRGVEGWRALIVEQRSSGESIEAFCKKRAVPRSSFNKWRSKLEALPAPKFLPLPIRATSAGVTPAEAVELDVSGVRVRLSGAAATPIVDAIVARLAGSA
jgi:hypothetical protein